MAILEKEVLIPINQRNINYYKKLGYVDIKVKDEIWIKIEHLSNSNRTAKLTKICDNPNCDVIGGRIIKNQSYQNILKSRKNNEFGYDLCKNCGKVFSWKERKNNIKYEKSLEYFAVTKNKLYLLQEFSDKNIKSPSEISISTLDKYLWNCPKCNSEYSATVSTRTNNDSRCPYCHGKAVNHTNCLWTTHPHVAKLLLDPKDGYLHTKGTHKKVNFKCPDCNNIIKNRSVANVIYQGLSCPKCSDGYSYPEKFMYNVLSQLNVDFEFQKIFEWSISKKYDFYIPSLNCIIETHGAQHYRYTGFERSLKEERENDELKERLAKDNGIDNYIIIDCSESSIDYIKTSIMNGEFAHYFNLNDIDWIECSKHACSSFLKTVCYLWSNGYKTTDIMKELKLSRTPILAYLKQGAKLGWCTYDSKEEMINSGKMNGGIWVRKPIVRLSLDGKYIDEFISVAEASRILNIPNTNISATCNGKRKSTGGYRFMFKDDYINIKEIIHPYIKRSNNIKSIVQLSLDNEYIRTWESIYDAQNELKITNISSVCCGKRILAGGFKWMYKDDYEKYIYKNYKECINE